MQRIFAALLSASLVLVACETTTPDTDTSSERSGISIAQTEDIAPNPEFQIGMKTVDQLLAAHNTPVAINRLTELIGSPRITDEERSRAIFRRGQLRYSEDGFNVWGAIDDFQEIWENYPNFESYAEAEDLLNTSRGEATSLNFALDTGELSRNERFSARFRLGDYVDAIDLMEATNLTPKNDELLAMYHIGYLCDSEDLTGRVYPATTKTGSELNLRFCDFGK